MDQMGFQVPGMASAPMNPPPPFFGGYGPDGGMSQLPPEIAAQMFPDSMLYEDPHEAKRRRIARACDMCRKKKIKCDGKLPACTQCINYKTDCVFTQVEKKRTPPKGAKYIEGLENRLERMEHLLRLSGLLDEEETDLGALEKRLQDKQRSASVQASQATASTPGSPSQRTATINATSPHSTNTVASPDTNRDNKSNIKKEESVRDEDEEAEVENLSDMMCSLVTNQSGETRYIGSSSGFSIFSPKGIQWVNSKTGDNSFQHMITEVSIDDHKWTNWKPEVFNDVFRRPVFRPLPPKPEALSLLQDYFENFNCMFPLFHQPTFMHLVERQYSPNPYQGSGWWASLNCALAIAHRLRVMSNLVPAEEDEKAWDYLKNALGVFAELTMRNTDLLSVQGLLGMALFMQGTPNPQPAFLLIASAMRLAHSIGLHKKGTGFNLNPIEIEQRKRVFWIAYILDKDICLRSGRPPAQDDDDMNVELPDADPEDNIGNIPLADGKGKMNLFRIMCEFSVIESNVYRRLYSTKASKQSNGELLNAIGELDGELEEWKDRIPIDFRPEHEIKASHTPLILHIVMLHLTYYNCLTTIHRMSVHHGFWTSRLSNYAFQGLNTRALNPRVYSSAALCTAAARASISMLKYIPQGDFSCVWMILYFPVSSLMILFGNILQNPLDPRAKSDTRLMNTVVTFLSMLGQEAEQGGVHRMLGVCAEFERIGRLVIEKAEKEQSSKRKRKTQDTSGASKPESAAASTGNPAMSGNTPAAHSKSPNMPNMPATPANSGVATQPSHAPTTTTPTTSTGAYLVPENAQEGFNLGTSPYSPFGGSSPGMMPNVSPWGQADFNQQQAMQPQNGDYETYTGFPPQDGRPVQFQQPLLPQGLFSLPATLDWNWAELSGGAYPTVENGNFGDFGGDDSNK